MIDEKTELTSRMGDSKKDIKLSEIFADIVISLF